VKGRRIAFAGTPEFAVPTLEAIIARGAHVPLVLTQPDRPAGRGRRMTPPPVKRAAEAHGLRVEQPVHLKDPALPAAWGLDEPPDLLVVVAYGLLLPDWLLAWPRQGCVNVHASLLPRWRGAAPIQWAILAGDRVTGVCTQRMEEGLDTGPLYLCKETPIDERETAGTLHDRLSVLAAEVAVETLELLGRVDPAPQPEEGVCWAPKIEKEDGRLDWSEPADALDRRVRAMTPWPGGFVPWDRGPLKLLEVRPTEGSGAPGEILSLSPLVVAAGLYRPAEVRHYLGALRGLLRREHGA